MRQCLIFVFAALLAASSALAQGGVAVPETSPLLKLAAKVGSGVNWAANDPRLLEEGRNRREVNASKKATKDFDRIAALDKAILQAKESDQLVLWFIPRITTIGPIARGGRQMYRPAVLERYCRATWFTNPDCVSIINARYVPVRLVCDEALGKRFGIVAPEIVEPAIVLINGDGVVVRKINRVRSFNANWFWRVLAHEAEKHQSKLTIGHADQELAYIEELMQRLASGDNKCGEELLAKHFGNSDKKPTAEESLQRNLAISIDQRRNGFTDEAILSLDGLYEEAKTRKTMSARQLRRDPLLAQIRLEEGRQMLAKNQLENAATAFKAVRVNPYRAEAWYLLGLCDFFSGKNEQALRRWKEVIASDENSPWAWKAAANLADGADRTSWGPTLHGFEDPFFTVASVKDSSTTGRARTPAEARELASESIRFLLRMQRENGGWTDSRYAYWPSPQITPNVWVAATSLACAALLEWRDTDPKLIDAAVAKGEAFMFDESRMNRGFQEEVYSDAYKLSYLDRKFELAKSDDERQAIVNRMDHVIGHLLNNQGTGERDKGFWGHEYPNGFTTAAIMSALHRAKIRGAKVPEKVMTLGAEALLSIRDQDGAYAYGAGRKPRGSAEERLKNSMARSPISEAALIWAGHEQGSTEKVAAAMDNFWKYLPRLEKIRVCDFHTDGELGGFFFWHGLYHTAESIEALPEAQQAPHRSKMVEFLTGIAEQDGSFIDSHEMGKSYGTAMGLLSLKKAMEVKKP